MIKKHVIILIGTIFPLIVYASSPTVPSTAPSVSSISGVSGSGVSSSGLSSTTASQKVNDDSVMSDTTENVSAVADDNTHDLNNMVNKPVDQNIEKKLMQNFIGLMIVLGGVLLLAALYKRTQLYKNFHEQPLRIVLSLALSPKQKLAIIELFGGYSLIAISEKNINLIQVLQTEQASALETYLASKKKLSLLPSKASNANDMSSEEKKGFENLLKKILNNPSSST